MSFSASTYGAGYSKTKSVATGLKSTSQNADGTIKVTYMDGKSYTTPNIKGADGKDGKDGHTPTVEEITPIVEGVFDAHKSEFVTPTNLKTVNGNSLIGSGDIHIEGGGSADESAIDNMGYLLGLSYSVIAETNGYVRANGTLSTSASARRTNYFDVTNFSKIKFVDGIGSTGYAVAFFDSNKEIMPSVSVLGTSSWKVGFVDIPANAKYCIFSVYRTSSMEIKLYKDIQQSGDIRKKYNRFTMYDVGNFGAFLKFGVIGDSLSVGCYEDKSGTMQTRNVEYSWGRQLARKLGNTCLNFGVTGVTSKTWFEQPKCYGEFSKAENLCQAYVVGLGANDASSTMAIGSIADVDFPIWKTMLIHSMVGMQKSLKQLIQVQIRLMFLLSLCLIQEILLIQNLRESMLQFES